VTTAANAGAVTDASASVDTDPTGAHVELRRRDTWVEMRRGTPTTGGCTRRWILSPGAFALRNTPSGDFREVPMPDRPGPEYSVYHVFCGGDYVASVWLRPQQFGLDPHDLAEQLVRDLAYPAARVGASPDGRGLTGLESWFWVEGYTGAPIVDTVSRFGLSVTVEARPASVSWDFGDGTTATGSGLGTPPPGRSDVTHVFETRGHPAVRVRAVIRLDVRWRLGAGPWQSLEPVARTATRDYPVVESRAALVPDR